SQVSRRLHPAFQNPQTASRAPRTKFSMAYSIVGGVGSATSCQRRPIPQAKSAIDGGVSRDGMLREPAFAASPSELILPMNTTPPTPIPTNTRREFLKNATKTTVGLSALSGITIPYVHAQGEESIRAALIGCGGRGSGAADNAMTVPD